MALSGTFYGTTTNERVKPKIVWSAVQNREENWSDVTATLYYSRTNNTSDVTAGAWVGSITIDGVTLEESKRLSIAYNSNTLAITNTVRVCHDSYGAKTLDICATGGISISSMKQTDIRATVTLDTIARATAIAAGSAEIESTLLIHLDRKNDSFTHSIGYQFGALQGYIDADGNPCATEVKLSGGTPWFHLPASFYSQIPDDPDGVGSLYCRTYAGDTQIGQTQSAQFTAVAAASRCKPEITATAVDQNPKTTALTGNPQILVKNHSLVRCHVTGTLKNGAGLEAVTVNKTPVEAQVQNGTFESVTDFPVTAGELSLWVEDSRGYAAKNSLLSPFIDYVDLTCRAAATRVDPGSGRAELTIEGKFFNETFTAVKNTLSLSYSVDGGQPVPVAVTPGARDYAVTVPVEGLDYQTGHKITVVAEDRLMRLEIPVDIGRSVPVFDWGETDFQFHVPVTGDFYGTVQGLHIRTVQLTGQTSVKVQSKWAAFDDTSDAPPQGIFLFGNTGEALAMGILELHVDDFCDWAGSGHIALSPLDQGQFEVMLSGKTSGWLTLLSAEPFEIV